MTDPLQLPPTEAENSDQWQSNNIENQQPTSSNDGPQTNPTSSPVSTPTQDQDSSINTEVIQQHKPDRIKTKPQRFSDYEVNLPPSSDHSLPNATSTTSMVHPLSHFVTYQNFTNEHKDFLMAISTQDEPKHFSQAIKNPNWR